MVQSEIVVVLKENDMVTDTRIRGVPNLVIEILSLSNPSYDQQLQKQLYQQHGIPEYWIVHGAAKVVEQNLLDSGGYYLANEQSDAIHLAQMDVYVDLTQVWSEE